MLRAVFREERCKGCGLCVVACPVHIIENNQSKLNEKGYFASGLIDPEKCIACGMCVTACPDLVIEVKEVKDND